MTARTLHVLCLLALVAAEPAPAPGRVPKVYNALITSNQNLEPSKAYPVYQPVIHDAFAYPFQPAVFYSGDYPVGNGLLPPSGLSPKHPNPTAPPTQVPSTPENTDKSESQPEAKPSEAPSSTPQPNPPESENGPTQAPPLPPNTQSPIPLNQFGLPPQVLPLSRFDPAYEGFTQVGPFTYSYPGFRFYDPYDPFNFSPYGNFPLYRPFPNLLSPVGPPQPAVRKDPPAPPRPAEEGGSQSPPSEPSDLNVLNYSSKDPAIPNVPPPPLPQGGLKSDNE